MRWGSKDAEQKVNDLTARSIAKEDVKNPKVESVPSVVKIFKFNRPSIFTTSGIKAFVEWPIEGVAKLHLGPNLRFWRRIRISRKSPMTNWICQFARNRTGDKIIKIGLQSEFCNSLHVQLQPQLRHILSGLLHS